MASHAGLVLVIKDQNGYLDKKGKIVSNVEDALRLGFYNVGFSDVKTVLKRLGYENNVDINSVEFETLEPSYESRICEVEDYLREMGCDREFARRKAAYAFCTYFLDNYDKYKKYILELKREVVNYIKNNGKSEVISYLGDKKNAYYMDSLYHYEREGYGVQKMYVLEEEIYRYQIRLNTLDLKQYFDLSDDKVEEYKSWQLEGLIEKVQDLLKEVDCSVDLNNSYLNVYFNEFPGSFSDKLNNLVRKHFEEKEMHITRMFGSYILLQRKDGELKAQEATNVPIKYCPLMIKLLQEIGGEEALSLIEAVKTEDSDKQRKMMCKLIDNIVIKGGYFDTNRALNSCEANVVFGASETISSAFKKGLIDAAVIVSNNLGTIITTNRYNTQGAVKRMTGLFYTSPSEKILETALREKIIPVFPYTAVIDQVSGVKEAIRRGYKRIAVTVAAQDNELLEEIGKLEGNGVSIYKFGLCSTGISLETAEIMRDNADIVWSCASKYVKELIEPNSIAEVGVKIPVHIMTRKGWELVKCHLEEMSKEDFDDVLLSSGNDKPVLLNSGDGVKKLKKVDIRKCNNCPYPCI